MASFKDGTCEHRLDVNQAVLLDLLVAQLTDFAIFITDCDGCIQSWNPGVERLLGYPEAQWLGQFIEIIFTPEDRQQGKPKEEMERAIANRQSPDIRWHQRRDGSCLFVEGTLVGLRDSTGKLVGFAKVMRDITERKIAEHEREQLATELQRSNEEYSQFAHMVAHDLQAPLLTVRSFAQLLQRNLKDKLDPNNAGFLNHILTGASGMQNLVEALLHFAEVGQGTLESKRVEMESVLETVLRSLEVQIREVGARISHDPLPAVSGDFILLVQLLQNLIGNAVKYRRPDEPLRIHIQAEKKEKSYVFAVQDNGQGIPQNALQKVFEPLTRLHGGEISGTGLGLATCQRIVNRHGGKIWADSLNALGATLYFRLSGA